MRSSGTVALVVRFEQGTPVLVRSFSDDDEIGFLEGAIEKGEKDPLEFVKTQKEIVEKEEEEFGNYVEELLSQPFLRKDIQEQGVRWLKSKIKIEKYKQAEEDATKIIAEYAYKIFEGNPKRREFLLAGPNAQVKIKVFVLDEQGEIRFAA